jgi:hypothetical protein
MHPAALTFRFKRRGVKLARSLALGRQELGPRGNGRLGALDNKRPLLYKELGPLTDGGFGYVQTSYSLFTDCT